MYFKNKNEQFPPNLSGDLYRLNRLETLQYHIDVAVLELIDGENEIAIKHLENEYVQGAISIGRTMDDFVVKPEQLKDKMQTVISEDFHGQNWSRTLWKNQEALRRSVSIAVADTMLRGKNPTTFISQIRKEFDASQFAARRLLITEATRVNANAQVEMMKRNGYEQFQIVTEPSACAYCKPKDGIIYSLEQTKSGVDIPPFHPHCKCGLVAFANVSVDDIEISNEIIYDKSMQNTGAIYGAWNDKNDPDETFRKKHAEMYYNSVRYRDTQNEVSKIAKHTGFSSEEILIVYNHLFENEYELENGKKRFDADYDIAQSWDRLFKNNGIQKHDITLLEHELLESNLMLTEGLSYLEAHKIAEIKHNYLKELIQWKIERGDWE